MSIEITGNAKLPESASIEIFGQPGRHEEVSVNTCAYINRDTDSKRIQKYLEDGWKWSLYNSIIVAEFPDNKKLLLDGDHRRHMFKLAFPEKKKIPAYIVQVEDMPTYHDLFIKLNFENRANISREEVFVHEVKRGKEEAIKINQHLINCGVSIYCSSEPDGVAGDTEGPSVKYGAFKRTLKRGVVPAQMATSLLLKSWEEDQKLYGELMESVAILYSLYPILSGDNKVAIDFKNWFVEHLSINKQNVVAKTHKNIGGSVQNKHAESLARGLAIEFRKVQLKQGCSARYKQNKISIASINKLID